MKFEKLQNDVAIDLSTIKSRIIAELNFKNPKPPINVDGLILNENGFGFDLNKFENKL